MKEEPSSSLGGDLGDLMNDRDLFKAFELGPVSGCSCEGAGLLNGLHWLSLRSLLEHVQGL